MRFLLAVVVVVAFAGAVGALMAGAYRRHPDAAGRARALRRIVLGYMTAFAVVGTVFIAAETLSDPGGWAAVGLVALWLVPMAALSLWGWYRPDVASDVLEVVVVLTVAAGAWYAADPGSWRAFENANGPVRAVGLFALAFPLVTVGYHRPRRGGVLLLGVTVLPVALASLASGGLGMASLSAIALPAFLAGVLDLVSVVLGGEGGEPAPSTEPAPLRWTLHRHPPIPPVRHRPG